MSVRIYSYYFKLRFRVNYHNFPLLSKFIWGTTINILLHFRTYIHTYMQCLYFKLNRKGGKQDEVTFIITSHSKHIYDDDDDDDEH